MRNQTQPTVETASLSVQNAAKYLGISANTPARSSIRSRVAAPPRPRRDRCPPPRAVHLLRTYSRLHSTGRRSPVALNRQPFWWAARSSARAQSRLRVISGVAAC